MYTTVVNICVNMYVYVCVYIYIYAGTALKKTSVKFRGRLRGEGGRTFAPLAAHDFLDSLFPLRCCCEPGRQREVFGVVGREHVEACFEIYDTTTQFKRWDHTCGKNPGPYISCLEDQMSHEVGAIYNMRS